VVFECSTLRQRKTERQLQPSTTFTDLDKWESSNQLTPSSSNSKQSEDRLKCSLVVSSTNSQKCSKPNSKNFSSPSEKSSTWTSTETLKLVCARVSHSFSIRTPRRHVWLSRKWTGCKSGTRKSQCSSSTWPKGEKSVPMKTTFTQPAANSVSWINCQQAWEPPVTQICKDLPLPQSPLLTWSWLICSRWKAPLPLSSKISKRKCRPSATSSAWWNESSSNATIKATSGSSTRTLPLPSNPKKLWTESSSTTRRSSATSSQKTPTSREWASDYQQQQI